MTDVSTQSNIQSALVARSKIVRTLVAGTEAMRKARQEYLPKEPMESAASYDNRARRSVLFNATGKTVADMTGKVFVKPVVLGDDVPEELKQWAENIDNAGRHLNVFARNAFQDALQPGIGYIFVDAPPAPKRQDGLPASLGDYRQAGWRPYLAYIPVERLIGWKSAVINGVETLTQIRIKECATIQDPDNEFLEKDVDQIRVVTRGDGACTWQTFRSARGQDSRDSWSEFESGTISLPEISLVPIYINRTDFMQGEPPLLPLAELNVAHWQLDSDVSTIMHIANVPILFGAGFDSDTNLAIGASEMVRTSNENAKLAYVEHSGAAIGAARQRLADLEMRMHAAGLQLLIDKPSQTATGEVRDDVKENSQLAAMATALEDALEQAFNFMAQFAGLGTDAGGSIVVNKEFTIVGSKFDLQTLTQAAIAGKIDTETYLNEMRRRGVLSEDTDTEVILNRIDNAAPDLHGEPMNLQG